MAGRAARVTMTQRSTEPGAAADRVAAAAVDAGYLGADDDPSYREAVVGLIRQAAEPALHAGAYDFGNTDLANRMSEQVLRLRVEQRFWRVPPPDILFLHRKLGGLYLLLSRLKASVPVRELVAPYVDSIDSVPPFAQTA